MTIEELQTLLTATESPDIARIIDSLKAGREPFDLTEIRKEYNPQGHKTQDKALRPDKSVVKNDPNREGETMSSLVSVNRIALSLQKIIVKRAVSFLFGNPVQLNAKPEGDKQQAVFDAINRILHDNKIDSFNRAVARDLFRTTEIAEVWFSLSKETHSDYGFDTDIRIRSQRFSTWDGNELYPLFDEGGDMIAFSRAFEVAITSSKKVSYFETYTDAEIIIWRKESGSEGWQLKSRTPNPISKIPVVYGKQEDIEWVDVQTAIERLEYLLSNFADTNDYHASPKIFVEGVIEGFTQKGESGGILQGTPGTKVSYLSWDHATESVKLEIDTLLRFIYSFTQTPDISFESVKSVGQIATETLKLLFLDAHLKVQDKREVFDAYLQRRVSILKAYVSMMKTDLRVDASKLQIDSEIRPFMISDTKALIELLSTATGGKPLLSQQTAVGQTGLTDDADGEFERIQSESVADVTQPTF